MVLEYSNEQLKLFRELTAPGAEEAEKEMEENFTTDLGVL
jgi:hypothetical protein